MKRNLVFGMAVLALGVFTVVAGAQPPNRGGNRGAQGQGGRQGRGGMMAGRGMTGRGMSATQLLRIQAVQDEIKLSEEQKQKLQALMQSTRPPFDRASMQNLSQEERRAKMQELFTKMREQQQEAAGKVAKILKPEQTKRLEQLRLQAMGPMAIRSDEVGKKIGLTDEQKQKIGENVRNVMTKLRGSQQAEGSRPSPEQMAKMRDAMGEATMSVLTDEQKKTYKEMLGKLFDTSKLRSAMSRGMGGGPGAARGGRPGQGRPGQGRPGQGRPGRGGGNG